MTELISINEKADYETLEHNFLVNKLKEKIKKKYRRELCEIQAATDFSNICHAICSTDDAEIISQLNDELKKNHDKNPQVAKLFVTYDIYENLLKFIGFINELNTKYIKTIYQNILKHTNVTINQKCMFFYNFIDKIKASYIDILQISIFYEKNMDSERKEMAKFSRPQRVHMMTHSNMLKLGKKTDSLILYKLKNNLENISNLDESEFDARSKLIQQYLQRCHLEGWSQILPFVTKEMISSLNLKFFNTKKIICLVENKLLNQAQLFKIYIEKTHNFHDWSKIFKIGIELKIINSNKETFELLIRQIFDAAKKNESFLYNYLTFDYSMFTYYFIDLKMVLDFYHDQAFIRNPNLKRLVHKLIHNELVDRSQISEFTISHKFLFDAKTLIKYWPAELPFDNNLIDHIFRSDDIKLIRLEIEKYTDTDKIINLMRKKYPVKTQLLLKNHYQSVCMSEIDKKNGIIDKK